MNTKIKSIDPTLASIVFLLVFFGFLIFSSASLGLLARSGASFSSVAFNQFFFGIVGGTIALLVTSTIHYRHWRNYAFYIFVASCLISLLIFIPDLSFSHGGATRWIRIGNFTFQPAEILKIGTVIYLATWLSGMQKNIQTFKFGTLPFLGFLAIPGILLLSQPDTDNFLIICAASVAMFLTAGGRWRDFLIMLMIGILMLALLIISRPYVMDRVTSFLDPHTDPQGSGYQARQALIAVGSGGLTGRGFGQSIQKFEYLPEPIGDSIFAVFAEEVGFIGSLILLCLFIGFALRGYRIATEAKDLFGMLLVVGIVTAITFQAILNIASIIGVAPISGIPLPFISHGGTALLVTLAAIGIVLNVSKFRMKRR